MTTKNTFPLLSLFSYLLLLASCSEFISPNVEKEQLVLNSPKDSLFTRQNEITFWWEENTKAEIYHLQMASPDMESPSSIKDTLTLKNTYLKFFEEGRYEWRIRMENNGSESIYQKRMFVIDNTPPISPEPINPLDSTYLDATNGLSLVWESLDYPIQDVSFPTKDSVYLYRVLGTELYPIAKKNISFSELKTWNISNYLEANKKYVWYVKTFDKAGNGKLSEGFRFYTN